MLVFIFYYTGFTWWLARRRLRGRVLVLTYHRVLPVRVQRESFSSDGIVVSPQAFEWQLRFLRRHFRILTIDEFTSACAQGKSYSGFSCLITFDDGWFDNLEYAEPILTHLQVPAVVFIATNYIGTDKCFWQERLARLLHESWRTGRGAHLLADIGGTRPATLRGHEEIRNAIREVIDRLKHHPPRDLLAFVDRLHAEVAKSRNTTEDHPDRFMSWDDVVRISESGFVTISSHAHSHLPLTRLDREEIAAELQQSRTEIQSRIGNKVSAIAYPNGDHDDNVVSTAKACGYVAGFTTIAGRYVPGDDPLRVKRVNIHERGARTAPGFLSRVIGLM